MIWLGGFLDGINGPLDTDRVKVVRDMMGRVGNNNVLPTGPIWVNPGPFGPSPLYGPGQRGYGDLNVTCDSKPVYVPKNSITQSR